MVPMPRFIQNTTVSNDPYKVYSLEYVVMVIPPGMTTRSIFTAWIKDLVSSVKWPLNVSSTTFVFSTTLLVFYSRKFVISQLVFRSLVWHMIISPTGIISTHHPVLGSYFCCSVSNVVARNWYSSLSLNPLQMTIFTYNWHKFLLLLFPPYDVCVAAYCIVLLLHSCLFVLHV
jgi:hypothetical protein